jgi:RNA recognition motif-containing protein
MEIYVGNLPFGYDQDTLTGIFSPHGQVEKSQIIMDRMTGRSRGFGFVTMPNAAEGQAAINALHGSEIEGRNITVNEARPREERPAGGGGGGYERRGGGGGGYGDRPQRRSFGGGAGGGGSRGGERSGGFSRGPRRP